MIDAQAKEANSNLGPFRPAVRVQLTVWMLMLVQHCWFSSEVVPNHMPVRDPPDGGKSYSPGLDLDPIGGCMPQLLGRYTSVPVASAWFRLD
jgi:hypothetical protein